MQLKMVWIHHHSSEEEIEINMSTIKHNSEKIMSRIANATRLVQRDSSNVCPIVVTKNRTNEEIQEIYSLGFRHFAENRVEKLLERQEHFTQEDIVWHLIGPLQKRKVRQIINRIHMFHAIDRLSIMEEIEKRLEKPLDCFLEVNVSGEESKHGFSADELLTAFKNAQMYTKIRIVGLMTMAPFDATVDELHAYFHLLAELTAALEKEFQLEKPLCLSMGMSNDFEIAITEGATHVRIGTAWFEKEDE